MEKTIDIDGLELHYDVTGPAQGLPLILMHGWGCSSATVRLVAQALETGMRVYSLDLPGHGRTPEPPAVWGVDDFTRMLEKFVSRLGIGKPSLAGHSFGGRVAILYASRNPVRKVLLIDAAGIKPRRKPSYYLKVYSFKGAKRILPLLLGRRLSARIIDRWRSKAGSADYRNSSPVMRAVMSRCINEDLTPVLPLINAPTLLVWGERDTATPMRDARIMERGIPDAGLVAFKDAGHYSFLDNPAGFRAVVNEFFKKENGMAPRG